MLGAPPRLGNRAVGLVPQRRELTSGLAIRGRDLVLLGVEGGRWGFGRPSAAARRQADWALEAVSAREFADEPMGVLSGGEQQRLLIAQALAPDLKVLLLDEPLASLDLRSQHEIVALVDGLRRRHGVAVLFVSHDLNPVLPVVDRVLYILNRCPVCGGVDEVVQPELLSHLFGTPVQVCRTHEGGRLVHGASPSEARWAYLNSRSCAMPSWPATLAAVCAGVIGYFVVLRRLSFASHALAHVGFTGATGAVLIGADLFLGTLTFTVATGIGMGLLGDKLRGRDTAIGTTLAFTMGLGLFFLSLSTKLAGVATNILFGDVLAVSDRGRLRSPRLRGRQPGDDGGHLPPPAVRVGRSRGRRRPRSAGAAARRGLHGAAGVDGGPGGPGRGRPAHLRPDGHAGGRRPAPDGAAGAGRGLVGAAGGGLGLGRADGGLHPVGVTFHSSPALPAYLPPSFFITTISFLLYVGIRGLVPGVGSARRRSARAVRPKGAAEVRVMETVE